MIVLVCGGREYADENRVYYELDGIAIQYGIARIVHGGCVRRNNGRPVGADYFAGKWARENNVFCAVYEAKWALHGNRAGPIRNALMFEKEKPDLVVAFPGGRGTDNMKNIAIFHGTRVFQVSA